MPRRALMGLALALVLGLGGCVAPRPAAADSVVETPHFRVTFVNHCLTPPERRAVVHQAHAAKVAILEIIGENARPGDLGATPQPQLAPPAEAFDGGRLPRIAPIPLRIVDRAGRSFADARGVEVTVARLPQFDLTHELVHYLAGASWHPIDEGLAVFLTEAIEGPLVDADVDVRTLVNLEINRLRSLDSARFLREEMTRVDYDASGSFVKYLVRTYGWARFFKLYRGAPGNYHWVYGKGQQDLFDEWVGDLRTTGLRRSPEFYRYQARITTGWRPPDERGGE